jgi:hypothetical protein
MKTGALIFAFNNEEIDYVNMAAWSAKNIRRHLDIPTAIVTDADTVPDVFEHVIRVPKTGTDTRYFEDVGSTVTWHNANRVDAYRLTPWDQTLVLDADYVVASDALACVLSMPQDFTCHNQARDMTMTNDFAGLNQFGEHRLPMWWATVMMFRKSNTAQYIFDCMNMVRDNWEHYRNLYGIQKKTYRNDFALSIGLGIVSGHTQHVDNIKWSLASIMPEYDLTEIEQDFYEVTYKDSSNLSRTLSWKGIDFHAMGKRHLGDIVAKNS